MAKQKTARRSKKTDPIERFKAMSDEQAEAVYKSVDRKFKLSETRPLTASQRRSFEKGRRPGRPKIGKGAENVSVTIERDLLEQTDAFAKQNKLKRSQLVVAGLLAVMENPKLLNRRGAA
jgi:hypothetical protein